MSFLKKPITKVYLAQLLSALGDRMWWFAGGIFMNDISCTGSADLMMPAIFTFAISLSVVVMGGTVGRWVDRSPRLKAARRALLVQNTLLVLCAITIFCTLKFKEEIQLLSWNKWLMIILQSTVILTSSLSRLATLASNILLQKDWVVVLAAGDANKLATINSIFRSIDLGTHVLVPLSLGFLLHYIGSAYGAIFIGAWNLVSMFIEYTLLWLIYTDNPALATKVMPQEHSATCPEKYATHEICPEVELKKHCTWIQEKFYLYLFDWIIYFQQQVCMAGIGLALLYMTVLGFDAVTVAYSTARVEEWVVGVSQALAALFGVFGAISFPFMRKCLGLGRVGLFGLSYEILSLTICVYSIWMPGSEFNSESIQFGWVVPPSKNLSSCSAVDTSRRNTPRESVSALLGGIIVSRFGLWLADITITQLFQESIQENKRGIVGGVQESMNMLMDVLKSILTIIYPHPQQFGLLIILSFVFVSLGFISYFIYYFNAYCHDVNKEDKVSDDN